MKPQLLLVDDEVDNVDALERIFRRDYEVFKATSGKEGLKILQQNPDIAVIISDQRMPEMSGVQMLKKSIKSHPESIRILLTGYTDIDSIVGAINSGEVYRYLNKPWDPVDLKNTVDKAAEKFNLRRELVVKNQELAQALEELKVLDDAKSNFMILINHELKTPLTVMTSFMDLLKETSLDDEQAKYIDRIEGSRTRLNKIIEDVLKLVSAETGLTKVTRKKVDIKKILQGLEGEFEEKASEKKLKLVFNADDISVKADAPVIQDVLRRILENAVKFSSKDSDIKLEVSQQKERAEFSVRNKGKALDQKTIDKIMKPFALDENILNHSQGMGIGLSLCQALLKAHNSELKFKSEKGTVSVGFEI